MLGCHWNTRGTETVEADKGLSGQALKWCQLWKQRNPNEKMFTFKVAFLSCYQLDFSPVLPRIIQNEVSDLEFLESRNDDATRKEIGDQKENNDGNLRQLVDLPVLEIEFAAIKRKCTAREEQGEEEDVRWLEEKTGGRSTATFHGASTVVKGMSLKATRLADNHRLQIMSKGLIAECVSSKQAVADQVMGRMLFFTVAAA